MRNVTISSTRCLSGAPALWLLATAICLGPAAAQAQTNTVTGVDALANVTTGEFNTADGFRALNATTTGAYNTASGAQALEANTTGKLNTAIGNLALQFNTTGNGNTACGSWALKSNTIGRWNTASGLQALQFNTTGNANTASGIGALGANTTGNDNAAFGPFALNHNTTGNGNAAFGYGALNLNIKGRYNAAFGAKAMYGMMGSHNIVLGYDAGNRTKSGNRNIYIGNRGVDRSESDVIRIGQKQTKTLIAGISGTPKSGATVVVTARGRLGVVASSARYKQDIEPLASGMAEKLEQLRPVSYRYKTEPEATHYGLIAEEVDEVMPELVVRDGRDRPDSVQYMELVPLLLQQWQAQQAENARQRAENERQRAENAELRALVERLAAQVAELRGTHLAAN